AKPLLPAGFTAVTGDKVVKESRTQVGQFLGIISTFLLVFALIAVLVGGFIIVNTFSILVAQRVRELALLRALGARRTQVTRMVLIEAFVMSLIASALGLVLGWLLAVGLARVFTSFGLAISGEALSITPLDVAIAMSVGVVVTVFSAFIPARKASRVPPVAAMQADASGAVVSLTRRTLIGVVFLILGALVAAYGVLDPPGNDAAWIGVGAFIWIITVAVVSPVIGKPVLYACRSLFGFFFSMPGRLAGDNALRDPRRTGATASALMIGLALVSTIGVLAASMNKSIEDVVDKTFQADFVVQSPGFMSFPTALADQMRKQPGVAVLSQQQMVPVKIDGKRTYATANDPGFYEINKLDIVDGADQPVGQQVLVGKSRAEALGIGVGDEVTLEFASRAPIQVPVVGIFDEQTAVTSDVTVPFDVFASVGISRQDTSLGIKLAPGVNTADVRAQLEKVLEPVPIVPLQDRAEFSKSIRGQVDQLLYIIYGLLALAILIAVIGIINTLGLSVLERTREIGLLRAVGLSRSRLRIMVALESVTISMLGAVLGLGLGLVFGSLLRYSMRDQLSSMALPISQLVVFLVIAVVVGLVAAIIPAIRAA
ncbi:MAG TPA: FtsX-like permease family protein, partial [Marmoricola sp.]|nr:FtsX-like permease family protein [Marmoricola sp.]